MCSEFQNAAAWRKTGVGCVVFYWGRKPDRATKMQGSCFVRDKVVPPGSRLPRWLITDHQQLRIEPAPHGVNHDRAGLEAGQSLEIYTHRHPFFGDVGYPYDDDF
jgi:hypothetical protein